MRLSSYFLFAVALLLLTAPAQPTHAQGTSNPRLARPNDPLSHDPRQPNSYDLDNELRNSKIGREVELALIEGNKAFSTNPPRFDEAEKAYLRAAKLEPKEAKAYVGLGVVYAAQNFAEKAAASFEKAVEVKPKYSQAHFNLALIYNAMGKKAEALEQQRILQGLDQALAKKLAELLAK